MEVNAPEVNAYFSALKTISFPISMVLMASVFQLVLAADLLDTIIANWPYDYGRVHSKNFTTPTAILFVVSYITTRIILKWYFINDKLQQELDEYYKKEDLSFKVHRVLPDSLTFFLIFFSFFIGFGVWVGVAICAFLLLGLELWIRSRFQ
ncbi:MULTISPECIES: hypothetical protein [unclassified Pseudoalteromonas]|uniref:hypothetical protein n=1 Tax=unclassified Pseudoalteromonas TaxID=194690 RepID=UPI00390C9988